MPDYKLLAVMLTTLVFSLVMQPVQAGNLVVMLEDQKGNPLKDAVIEIISPVIPVPANWDFEGLMDQKDKEFINKRGHYSSWQLRNFSQQRRYPASRLLLFRQQYL